MSSWWSRVRRGLGVAVLTWSAAASAGPWMEQGRPTAQAREAVQLLEAAADQGLLPQDYGTTAIT